MSKNEIIIHVGYPKTGTTTLQKYFFPEIEGIQYLGKHLDDGDLFDFDNTITNQILFGPINNENIGDIRNLIALKISNKKIVLSQETFLFSSLRVSKVNGNDVIPKPLEIAKRIKEIFNDSDFDIKIIFTIRRQDEMITSLYAQGYTQTYSKYRQYNTFKKFLDIYLQHKNKKHIFKTTLNYYNTIEEYKSIFGNDNIFVLVFEELQKKPAGFYEKVCKILDIDTVKYENISINKHENKRSIRRKNYKNTMEMNVFEKLAAIKNTYFPFLKINISEKKRKLLRGIVISRNNSINKTIFLTEVEKKRVMVEYQESNKKLSQEMNLGLEKYGYFN